MKQSDAARCGKASEVMVERIQSAIEKLNAREAAVMKALESLPAINDLLETSFTKWSEVMVLDEEDELWSWPPDQPSIDVDGLTEAIQEAFTSAREALENELPTYEEVVTNATDYEEPEEEEEDEEESVFTCDHAGCKEETDLSVTKAREAGWEIYPKPAPPPHRGEIEWSSFCPKHRR